MARSRKIVVGSWVLLISGLSVGLAATEEELTINVNGKRPLAVVSDKFLSITLDPVVLFGGDTLSDIEKSISMAQALSPAYLRIAGPRSNSYAFRRDLYSQEVRPNDGYEFSEAQWTLVNKWARRAGLDVIACIAPRLSDKSHSWEPTNALDLISFSDRLGYNASWQLGYECQARCKTSGSKLGQEVQRLRKMLDAFPRYSDEATNGGIVIGPDVVTFKTHEQQQYLQDYFSVAGSALTAITWHPDFAGISIDNDGVSIYHDNLATEKDSLHKIAGTKIAKKPLWIAESKREVCKQNFLGALVWARRLGNSAKLDIQVLMRQPDHSDLFRPTPDYWVSMLHKLLVGRVVLDVKIANGNRTHVFFYAHCTKPSVDYEKGSLTIFGINLTPTKITASVALKGLRSQVVHKYVLLPGFDAPNRMFAQSTMLNNELLTLVGGKKVPHIRPVIYSDERGVKLSLPSGGIGFWVLPGVKIKACMEQEEEMAKKNLSKKIAKQFEDLAVDPPLQSPIPSGASDEQKRSNQQQSQKRSLTRQHHHKDFKENGRNDSEESRKFQMSQIELAKRSLKRLDKILNKRDNQANKRKSESIHGVLVDNKEGERKSPISEEDLSEGSSDSLETEQSEKEIQVALEEYRNHLDSETRKKQNSAMGGVQKDLNKVMDTEKAIEALTLITKVENVIKLLEPEVEDQDSDSKLNLQIGNESSDALLREVLNSKKSKRTIIPTGIEDQLKALYQLLSEEEKEKKKENKSRQRREFSKNLEDDRQKEYSANQKRGKNPQIKNHVDNSKQRHGSQNKDERTSDEIDEKEFSALQTQPPPKIFSGDEINVPTSIDPSKIEGKPRQSTTIVIEDKNGDTSLEVENTDDMPNVSHGNANEQKMVEKMNTKTFDDSQRETSNKDEVIDETTTTPDGEMNTEPSIFKSVTLLPGGASGYENQRTKRQVNDLEEILHEEMMSQDDSNSKDCHCRVIRASSNCKVCTTRGEKSNPRRINVPARVLRYPLPRTSSRTGHRTRRDTQDSSHVSRSKVRRQRNRGLIENCTSSSEKAKSKTTEMSVDNDEKLEQRVDSKEFVTERISTTRVGKLKAAEKIIKNELVLENDGRKIAGNRLPRTISPTPKSVLKKRVSKIKDNLQNDQEDGNESVDDFNTSLTTDKNPSHKQVVNTHSREAKKDKVIDKSKILKNNVEQPSQTKDLRKNVKVNLDSITEKNFKTDSLNDRKEKHTMRGTSSNKKKKQTENQNGETSVTSTPASMPNSAYVKSKSTKEQHYQTKDSKKNLKANPESISEKSHNTNSFNEEKNKHGIKSVSSNRKNKRIENKNAETKVLSTTTSAQSSVITRSKSDVGKSHQAKDSKRINANVYKTMSAEKNFDADSFDSKKVTKKKKQSGNQSTNVLASSTKNSSNKLKNEAGQSVQTKDSKRNNANVNNKINPESIKETKSKADVTSKEKDQRMTKNSNPNKKKKQTENQTTETAVSRTSIGTPNNSRKQSIPKSKNMDATITQIDQTKFKQAKLLTRSEELVTPKKENTSRHDKKRMEIPPNTKSYENGRVIDHKIRREELEKIKLQLRAKREKILQQYRDELIEAIHKNSDIKFRNRQKRDVLATQANTKRNESTVDQQTIKYIVQKDTHQSAENERKIPITEVTGPHHDIQKRKSSEPVGSEMSKDKNMKSFEDLDEKKQKTPINIYFDDESYDPIKNAGIESITRSPYLYSDRFGGTERYGNPTLEYGGSGESSQEYYTQQPQYRQSNQFHPYIIYNQDGVVPKKYGPNYHQRDIVPNDRIVVNLDKKVVQHPSGVSDFDKNDQSQNQSKPQENQSQEPLISLRQNGLPQKSQADESLRKSNTSPIQHETVKSSHRKERKINLKIFEVHPSIYDNDDYNYSFREIYPEPSYLFPVGGYRPGPYEYTNSRDKRAMHRKPMIQEPLSFNLGLEKSKNNNMKAFDNYSRKKRMAEDFLIARKTSINKNIKKVSKYFDKKNKKFPKSPVNTDNSKKIFLKNTSQTQNRVKDIENFKRKKRSYTDNSTDYHQNFNDISIQLDDLDMNVSPMDEKLLQMKKYLELPNNPLSKERSTLEKITNSTTQANIESIVVDALPKIETLVTEKLKKAQDLTGSFKDFIETFDETLDETTQMTNTENSATEVNDEKNDHSVIQSTVNSVKKFFDVASAITHLVLSQG